MEHKLKVALVVPKSRVKIDFSIPLNLAGLASFLLSKKSHVTIRIIDGLAGDNVFEMLKCFQPNIVGVSATTPEAPAAYIVGDWLRASGVYCVIGGAHASALPKEALQHFDCVVVGEGETALVRIVDAFEVGKPIRGIIAGEPFMILDDLPMPAYHLVKISEYLTHGPSFAALKKPSFTLLMSRGCPFRCPFCYNSTRKSPPRYFSAKRIIDEIQFLLAHYKISSFLFVDDDFLINKKVLLELGRLMKERNVKIVWGCQARASTLTKDVLLLAKRMGCVFVLPGFENMSPRILNYLKCGTTTPEMNERAVRVAKEAGMPLGCNFVFGTPTETIEEMEASFDWYLKNGSFLWATVASIVPFPGTTLYAACRKKGLLPEHLDYERFKLTNRTKEVYVIDKAVDPRVYRRFMFHTVRIAWVLRRLRCGDTFRSLLNDLHFWYLTVYHPIKTLKMLECRLKHEPVIC